MPQQAPATRPHVAVVGGGIAGLAAALELLDTMPAASRQRARGQRPDR